MNDNKKSHYVILLIGIALLNVFVPYVLAEGDDLSFTELGQFPGGATYVLAMDGTTLYTATGAIVEIWSISSTGVTPANYMVWPGTNEMRPQKEGEIRFGDYAVGGLAINGKTLYVGTERGLEIYDITTPSKPNHIGSHYGEPIGAIKVKNGRLYASTDFYYYDVKGTHRLVIFDVSTPQNPIELGGFTVPITKGSLERIEVSGNYAYLPLLYNIKPGYIFVVDVSDPANPTEATRFNGTGYAGFSAVQIDETRKILFALEYRSKLHAYDISNPKNPVQISEIGSDYKDPLGQAADMKISGSFAYFSTFYEGIRVVDITDPKAMHLEAKGSSSPRFGYVYDIVLNGNYAYVANMGGGFSIFNIAVPAKPTYVTQLDTHGIFYDVRVAGKYAYVAADYEFMVFDVSDPNNPVHTGSVEWARSALGGIKDNYVFVDNGWRPLAVVDVSNPSKPVVANQYSDHTKAGPIVGNTMYLGKRGSVHILDLSQLPKLNVLGIITEDTTWAYPPSLAIKDNFLYAGYGTSGVKIYDVTNPANVQKTGEFAVAAGDRPTRMVIQGDYLYILGDYRLYTYDISSPGQPVKTSEIKHSGWHMGGAYGMGRFMVYKDYLISGEMNGVVYWNIVNPSKPAAGKLIPLPVNSNGEISGFDFDKNDRFYGAVSYKGIDVFSVKSALVPNHPPVMALIGNKTISQGELLEFTVTAHDPDGDVLQFSATGMPSGAGFDATSRVFSWTPVIGQAGKYNVTFTVSDGLLADKESVMITVLEAVTNQKPIIEPIANRTVPELERLEFTVMAHDPDGDVLMYSADNLPKGAVFDTANRTFDWTPQTGQAGAYSVVFTVSDSQLAESAIVEIKVVDVIHPPAFDAIGNKTVNEGVLLEFSVNATDPDGDILQYSAINLPSNAAFDVSNRTFTWIPQSGQAGTYTVTFLVTDGEITATLPVGIQVTAINRQPAFNEVGNKTIKEGEKLEFTINALDPDGDTLQFSAEGLPTGAGFDAGTRTFSWIPGFDQAGIYTVDFIVAGGEATVRQTVTITVLNANRAPAFVGNYADITINEGQILKFPINATDPDGDTIQFGAAYMPTGAIFHSVTRTLIWTPSFTQAGAYTVTFIARDSNMLATYQKLKIQVLDVNQPPVLDTIGDKTVPEGQTLVFSIRATDPDGDIIRFSAEGISTGASFDEQTGTFNWTPGYDQSGSYPVTFIVSDGKDETRHSATITVVNVNRAPAFTGRYPDIAVYEGNPVKVSISAEDPDRDNLQYSAGNLPSGAWFDSTTQTFTWNTKPGESGTYPMIFTVSDGDLTTTQQLTVIVLGRAYILLS